MVIGNGMQRGVTLAPLSTKQQYENVKAYMALAADTATVVYGGKALDNMNGYYVMPTIVTGVDGEHRLAKEEIFGPFLIIIPVSSYEEAIYVANNVEYGLASSVFTSEAALVKEYVTKIKSGMAHVNEQTTVIGSVPFGGMKNSGFGAFSNGDTAKDFYMQDKVIYFA